MNLKSKQHQRAFFKNMRLNRKYDENPIFHTNTYTLRMWNGRWLYRFFLSIICLWFFSVRVSCYADLLWIAFHSCTNNVLYCFRRNTRNIVKRNLIQLGYIHIYAHLHWIFTWYFVHIYRIGISSQFHQILHLLQRITNSSLFSLFSQDLQSQKLRWNARTSNRIPWITITHTKFQCLPLWAAIIEYYT